MRINLFEALNFFVRRVGRYLFSKYSKSFRFATQLKGWIPLTDHFSGPKLHNGRELRHKQHVAAPPDGGEVH